MHKTGNFCRVFWDASGNYSENFTQPIARCQGMISIKSMLTQMSSSLYPRHSVLCNQRSCNQILNLGHQRTTIRNCKGEEGSLWSPRKIIHRCWTYFRNPPACIYYRPISNNRVLFQKHIYILLPQASFCHCMKKLRLEFLYNLSSSLKKSRLE